MNVQPGAAASVLAPPPRHFGLGEARAMIGQELLLRRPLLGFKPGTPCRVQCVVDFGDGLHLWITTADERQADVDQIDAEDLERYFIVLHTRSDTAATHQPDPAPPLRRAAGLEGHAGHGLAAALRRAAAGLLLVLVSVRDSWSAARDAQRMLVALETARDAEARERVIGRLRERLCGPR